MDKKEPVTIHFPGMSEAQKKETEARILEWERDIEPGLLRGKGGYVDLIKPIDYYSSGLVTIIIIIYYFWAVS